MAGKKLDIGDFTINFGNNKGKRFKDLDVNYKKWLLEEDVFKTDPKYKWNDKIREYLESTV